MRGIGITEALGRLPDLAVPVFAVITQLGDVWFVFFVLSVLYFVGDRVPHVRVPRARVALVIGLALGALALTGGLKAVFALPRPSLPETVRAMGYVPAALRGAYTSAATASGYGFPSGHALLSTVFWGALAITLDVSTRGRRALAAGTVITLVCLARLVLGVHYAVDVVAGVAVGCGYLALVTGLARGRTRVSFGLAAAIAIASLFVEGATFDSVSALGAALGALVTWGLLGHRIPPHTTHGLLTTIVGLVVLGGGFGAVYAFGVPLIVVGLVNAAVFVVVLALPLVADSLENRHTSTR